MPSKVPERPYSSSFDLPSFQKIDKDLRTAQALSLFAGREARARLTAIERDQRELGETVDSFYGILGPRNWVFHDLLPVGRMRNVLKQPTPEAAERAFIDFHRDEDWLSSWAGRVSRGPLLQPWQPLVELALQDYSEHRYYSSTLVLLAVMDGFVNNLDKGRRRGLHTRTAEDMKSWDSVTGHHMGLTRVIPIMMKPMNAPVGYPVFEVHRNGIMHGNVLDFNNDTVGTKAWNYFFAVLDWAADVGKRAEPEPTTASWGDVAKRFTDLSRQRRAIKAWTPHTLYHADQHWQGDQLVLSATAFFDSWKASNYGGLAESLQASSTKRLHPRAARSMRITFQISPIEAYVIDSVDFTAPSIGVVHATITRHGKTKNVHLRWVYEDDAGALCVAGSDRATWRRVADGPPL